MIKNNFCKRIIDALCIILLVMGVFILSIKPEETTLIMGVKKKARYADIVAEQNWGGCKWKIEEDGKLLIYAATNPTSGYESGEMRSITSTTGAPWHNYANQIKTIQVGQANEPSIHAKSRIAVRGLFRDCSNATEVNFVNFDSENITNMSHMFYNCTLLETIQGLDTFNTSNVVDMNRMFYKCNSLQSLNDITHFDTSKVEDMSYMLGQCLSMQTIDISTFDTRSLRNCEKMMYQSSFTKINMQGENFVSTNITNMGSMFPGSLTEISIGRFDFKIDQVGDGGVSPYPWGRGTWEKFVTEGGELVSKGLYPAIQIAKDSSNENIDISGTYKKVSNIADVFGIDTFVTYSINDFFNTNKTTCEIGGEITANIDIKEETNPADSLINVYIDIPLNNSVYTFSDCDFIKVKIEDAVSDVNNNKYDLEINMKNLYINNLNLFRDSPQINVDKVTMLPIKITPNTIGVNSTLYDNHIDLNSLVTSIKDYEVSYDITFAIRNKDGSAAIGDFMFSAYDIDYRDIDTSSGATTYSYDSPFAEGVNLLSGFNTEKIYTTEATVGTWINKEFKENNVVRLRGSNNDNSTELSEFLVPADATGASFTWTAGYPCGTNFLSTYQPKIVKINKIEDTGEQLLDAELKLSGSGICESWTTGDSEKSFFLNPGQYTLEEISSPTGYKKADDIIFRVENGKPIIRNDGVVVQNDTIIMVDYKDNFNYTVEYYYDNVKDDSKAETGSALYQSIIEDYNDKKIEGYEFDRTENLPLTISENSSNNIIKVYYYPIRMITINHVDINTNEVLKNEEEKGKEGQEITTAAMDFSGYALVTKPDIENYTLNAEPQIVNYYYAKISKGVVEKHINIETDKYVADDKIYEGYEGKDYLTSSKDIADYDIVTNEKYYRTMAKKDVNFLSNNGVATVDEFLQKLDINADDLYIPENYKGKMTEELIEVKYYYVKNDEDTDNYSNKTLNEEDKMTILGKIPQTGDDLIKVILSLLFSVTIIIFNRKGKGKKYKLYR